MQKNEMFGQRIRRLREETGMSLRSFAKMLNRTPTYISKIERDEFSPPAEEIVREMARILKQDADDMLILAGRIPADLLAIVMQNPKESTLVLRAIKGFSPVQMQIFLKVVTAIASDEDAALKEAA